MAAVVAPSSGPVTVRDYEDLVVELHRIEAVKFGSFTLKSGIQSPVYVDLRVIVSHPAILARVAEVMWDKVKDVSFDILCGVPYTALPIATAMSLVHGKPMVMRRKEVKEYGTKKAIEGSFLKGDKVLIVEDLVTSGLSVAETVEPLEAVGLVATDVVVLIDRQQGGATNMAAQGLNLHSAFTLGFILDVLVDRGLVAKELADEVKAFLANNQVVGRIPEKKAKAAEAPAPAAPKRLSYAERAPLAQNAMAKRILETMDRKQSNLSVAVDVATPEEMLRIADAVGPHVCVLKTHVDVFDSWDMSIAHELEKLAKKHDFVIFEDRKFADIGNTVAMQYSGGVYKIASWSDITNAHLVPGPGIIDGLKTVGGPLGKGLLLLAEMSSKGTLANGSYTTAVAKAAVDNQDFVCGFISVSPRTWPADAPTIPAGLIHMTPGVQLSKGGDALGQQYNTPDSVIKTRGSDVIIVGRGVIKADDPAEAAKAYKEAGWKAYLEDLERNDA